MTSKVEDFKDSDGNWVYRFTNSNGERFFTRAGMLWHGLRQRTNPNGKKQQTSPLYKGSKNMFKDFQTFAEWCQTQIGYRDGFQLDKDILFKGNLVYSELHCVFVPQEINKLFTKRDRFRGGLPIGVTMDRNSFRASCNNGTGKAKSLGNFSSAEAAYNVYKSFKESHIKQQAELWKDKISGRLYLALINYQVEITD
jgi:hypothetical protein